MVLKHAVEGVKTAVQLAKAVQKGLACFMQFKHAAKFVEGMVTAVQKAKQFQLIAKLAGEAR